jgi:glycine dehydrogenase subunit 1
MLSVLGHASIEDLFSDVPEKFRFPRLALDEGLSEYEVLKEIAAMAEKNLHADSSLWFLGAGAYDHFIPSAVGALSSRGEFLTAYTPYQSEVSQGTLQAIFEYQSMAAELLGTEVVNAGHYDGATALAEAVIMALKNAGVQSGVNGQNDNEQNDSANNEKILVLLPAALHPEYRRVIDTYLVSFAIKIETYSGKAADAVAAINAAKNTGRLACLVASYPDFFGVIPDLSGAADAVHAAGGAFIVHADPLMLGLIKSPGEMGADIVTAEGQALGNELNYGGPYLGIMGVNKTYMRKIPGRIAGEAYDKEGRRGFVLTLSAREQHIRREKAVSNICSNQGLAMLRTCIYLALMGKKGLRDAAELCWHRAHYAADQLAAKGFAIAPKADAFFKEFTVTLPCPAEEAAAALAEKRIVAGFPLSRYFPDRKNDLLICVTEKNSKADIDSLVSALGGLHA